MIGFEGRRPPNLSTACTCAAMYDLDSRSFANHSAAGFPDGQTLIASFPAYQPWDLALARTFIALPLAVPPTPQTTAYQ